jgi:hypothetical protein
MAAVSDDRHVFRFISPQVGEGGKTIFKSSGIKTFAGGREIQI